MVDTISGVGFIQATWSIKIFNIQDKQYNVFRKNSHIYNLSQNNEIQDIRKFLALLREKTQEALEAQGKAECYNLKEKIQYKPRKDF